MQIQINDSIDKLTLKLTSWLDLLITNMPNIILGLSVFGFAYYISQKLHHWIYRLLKRRFKQESIRSLIANFASIIVIALGLFLSLSIMNLDKALTSILAGAGVAGLAIGLALQGTISNTFSGIFLAVKDIMNIGDFIQTNGYSGTVEDITLRYVVLKEVDNNLVIIPNKLVVEHPFKNFGLTQQIKATVTCGVAYDADLEKVEDVTRRAIERSFPQGDRKIDFHFLEFGSSSINFQTRFWVDAESKLNILEAQSETIKMLKKLFEKEGIEIPFPTRTLITQPSVELVN